jgi:hypothetical protein
MTWPKSFFRFYVPFVLFGILVLFLAGFYPIIRFPEEQIDIEVYPDYVWVKGTYTYKNPLPFPVTQGFTIPLPVDADHPEPVQLTAKVLTPHEKPIRLKYLLGRHRFSLKFRTNEKITVSVAYRQQAPAKNGRYILLSTKAWRRPLNHGLYRMFLKNVRMTSSNYRLNKSDTYLFFQKENFMPPEDWIFSWEET